MKYTFFSLLVIALSFACNAPQADQSNSESEATVNADSLIYDQERHFQNMNQLTFGGDNAEAYFSFDNSKLVFQATNPSWGAECDQIYYMPITGFTDSIPPLVSTGNGRTTCAFFMPGDTTILYASTHLGNEDCPETPRVVDGKYVWPIYPDFDIFEADLNGNIVRQLTTEPGYDAEATLSPDGGKIVFTSTRSGDLELYTMDIDGSNVQQVTDELGYDGGAFFSPDGTKLIFRASRPQTEEEKQTYTSLLEQGLVQPSDMELFICNVDGSNLQQITDLGGANWAPFFHPSGKKVLFSTNHHIESGRQFNIFSIDIETKELEQITFDNTFDAFPMFSWDGKYLVFSSNRNNGGSRDTNIFITEWVD